MLLKYLAGKFCGSNLFSLDGFRFSIPDTSLKIRHVEKLPKVVLGNEESHAVLNTQQLLVIIYYSGPRLVVDQLQSPVCVPLVNFLMFFYTFLRFRDTVNALRSDIGASCNLIMIEKKY